jgi:O-antigen ligase
LTLIAAALFASAKSFGSVMTGGLILLVIATLLRWGSRGRPFQASKLDWPLALLVVSGGLSLAASYDFGTSLAKFCLILAGVSLFYSLSGATLQLRLATATGVVLLAAGLALFFITQQNQLVEASAATKFPLLGALGDQVRRLSPQLNLYEPHPNVVIGVLEIAFFLGVGLLLVTYRSRSDNMAMLVGLGLALAILALAILLTGSRGGWLALGVAGLGWFISEMKGNSRLRTLDTIALLVILASLLFLLLLEVRGPAELSTSQTGGSVSRLALYQGAMGLIRDYIFTGAGLGTFPMLYSAYILEHDVVVQNHTHNFYLSVWLEQGLLGLIALLWLAGATLQGFLSWQKRHPAETVHSDESQFRRLLARAAFWAMVVIFVHGLIDSVPYNSRFLPLIFIPLGCGSFLTRHRRPSQAKQRVNLSYPLPVIVGSVILVGGLLLWGWPLLAASWYANLGAVRQVKIELNDYEWPDRIPSKVRPAADLSPAISLYERALQLSPDNATARERLDLINRAKSQSTNK